MRTICKLVIFTLLAAQLLPAMAQKPAATKPKPKSSNISPGKTAEEKEPPITDTFAYQVQNTVGKVVLYATDPARPVEALMGAFMGTPDLGQPQYRSIISFPAAVENSITRIHVYRDLKKVMWEWHAVLVRVPKGTLSKELINDLVAKINAAVSNMQYPKTDKINSISSIKGYSNADWANNKYDEVELQVYFYKPVSLQTDEAAIDSVRVLYKPGFASIETAKDASSKFTMALLAEGFSEERTEEITSVEVKKVADRDIKTAYEMATGVYWIKPNMVLTKLSDNQREQVRNIAQAYLDAYKEQRPFDIRTFDPSPPPPVVYNYNNPIATPVNPNLYKQKEPEGKRVKCPVCAGRGQIEVVDYAHTYSGIFSNIRSEVSHWTTCTYCGGGGWVTKYKK